MAEKDDVTAVTLALSQTVALWTVLCPPITDVRHHNMGTGSPEFVTDVRHAELVAGTLALAVGATMSVTTSNPRPVMAAAVVVAAMIAAYEYTLYCPGTRGNLTRMETAQ